LKLNQTLNQVSRGQRIQGLLALSLSAKPEVLLIDEATAVLDPFIRNRLMMELERINRETGMTVLIATNIATEVAVLKGRLLIMQGGKLVIDRSAEKMSEGFIKIRVSANEIDETQHSGFSFLERNQDGSYSFLGRAETLPALSASYLVDQRSITIDELFIFFSERRTA
jgi:ABC-type multidrug transport system ATPase subunit